MQESLVLLASSRQLCIRSQEMVMWSQSWQTFGAHERAWSLVQYREQALGETCPSAKYCPESALSCMHSLVHLKTESKPSCIDMIGPMCYQKTACVIVFVPVWSSTLLSVYVIVNGSINLFSAIVDPRSEWMHASVQTGLFQSPHCCIQFAISFQFKV